MYMLIIGFGLIAQIFVRDNLVDYNDASITASNIITSEFLFRFGFVSELLMLICDLVVTTILYLLLKDFSQNLSLLSTFFRLTSITVLGVTALSHYAALSFLGGAQYLTVFTSDQLDALALLSIKLHGSGYNICLLFFGFHLIILGYLVYRSDLFPNFLGILLLIGGLCYNINSITWFLFPSFVGRIYPAILIPSFMGELLFSLWLVIKGVSIPPIRT
ncbi:MAG: DUF4386 domain-containing protein [Cyclobacteriaceae bacterium]|nr:DUF4386 domain-containing protein [Cyclobacteriaceae bacterium]MDH5249462.1 DUF4386 domain-containing protein [Cyclobacteriaceae bacterium]